MRNEFGKMFLTIDGCNIWPVNGIELISELEKRRQQLEIDAKTLQWYGGTIRVISEYRDFIDGLNGKYGQNSRTLFEFIILAKNAVVTQGDRSQRSQLIKILSELAKKEDFIVSLTALRTLRELCPKDDIVFSPRGMPGMQKDPKILNALSKPQLRV